jgi:Helix-turn-helix.
MFGLEYLCNLYDMQQTELAEKVGVSKQIVNIWMKKTRPIPKKYYDKLSEIFKGIDSKYFSKELTELDKLEIQMQKLDSEWVCEEYEDQIDNPVTGEPERDENGNIIIVKKFATDKGQEMEYERLKYEVDEVKLINRLKQTLAEVFYNEQLKENYVYGDEINQAYSVLNLYELFIRIIEKGGISRNTIRTILESINIYQNGEMDKYIKNNKENDEEDNRSDKDILIEKVGTIIKDEEQRIRKQAEYWLEMSKGMEDLFK